MSYTSRDLKALTRLSLASVDPADFEGVKESILPKEMNLQYDAR